MERKIDPHIESEDKYFGFLDSIESRGEKLRLIFDAVPAKYFLKDYNNIKIKWDNLHTLSIHLLPKKEELDTLSRDKVRFIEERWYFLELSDSGPRAEIFHDISSDNEEISHIKRITHLRKNGKLARQLYKQFSLDEFPDANERDLLRITRLNGERISFIAAYNVGQGNCNALCSLQSEPLVYFDFGCGCYHHRNTYNGMQRYCFEKKPPIILSHWHADHWAATAYTNEAFDVPWIVPRQKIGATPWKHASQLYSKGNLHIWPASLNSLNTRIGTIIKCQGRHKNHSGLSLLTAITGKQNIHYYLLPGDSAFRFIPIRNRPLDGFIAPHHGAYIACDPLPHHNSGQIIYSYGAPNSYGHPDPRAIRRYELNGWQSRGDTVSGHWAMGWRRNKLSLRLNCQGRKCDLLINQIL